MLKLLRANESPPIAFTYLPNRWNAYMGGGGETVANTVTFINLNWFDKPLWDSCWMQKTPVQFLVKYRLFQSFFISQIITDTPVFLQPLVFTTLMRPYCILPLSGARTVWFLESTVILSFTDPSPHHSKNIKIQPHPTLIWL